MLGGYTGLIAWEARNQLGCRSAFIRTLIVATLNPKRLARATAAPMDTRSALLFRWIVRVFFCIPCIAVFCFLMVQGHGLMSLQLVDGPRNRTADSLWEAKFIWSVGATNWVGLPVGFIFTVILATGITHWFNFKRLETARRNRAMAFSCYLCAPLAWIFVPCLAAAAAMNAGLPPAYSLPMNDFIRIAGAWIASLSCLAIAVALANSVRAASTATQGSASRLLFIGAGLIVQAALAAVLGLLVLPLVLGLCLLMIESLTR